MSKVSEPNLFKGFRCRAWLKLVRTRTLRGASGLCGYTGNSRVANFQSVLHTYTRPCRNNPENPGSSSKSLRL